MIRFVFAAQSNRYSRVMLEEAIRYGRNRKTFNKRLMDHQVLRHKVAEMARHIEATHALLRSPLAGSAAFNALVTRPSLQFFLRQTYACLLYTSPSPRD